MTATLIDPSHRRISYLRLSVTDRCQFRCVYCMPPDGIKYLPKQDHMTVDEVEQLVRAAAGLGIWRGSRVTAAAIGLLAAAGITSVPIRARPKIAILATGSEILECESGIPSDNATPPPAGKIYDSNAPALTAALHDMGLPIVYQTHVSDNEIELKGQISEAIKQCDFLIITGGVSVGDYDFVKDIAAQIGIENIFWRVKQKPGKPLFFGSTSQRDKYVFGLPGNPASTLTCFYEYVRPALRIAMGSADPFPLTARARLTAPFSTPPGLTHFLKAQLHPDGAVEILERQGSHMLSTFVISNCFVMIDEDATQFQKGDMVEIHLIP